MRILALDTSMSKSGWAVISVIDRKPTVIDYGLIKTNAKLTDGERLRQIVDGIHEVISRYPDIEATIPREEGIVRHNIATRQVFKAHGASEFALANYDIHDVNIQTVKAWARRVIGAPGKRQDKDMIAEAVREYFTNPQMRLNKEGDEADAISVGIVYLKREGAID